MCFECQVRDLIEDGHLPIDRALVIARALGVRRSAVESCDEHRAMGNEIAAVLMQTSSGQELVPT